MKKITPLILMMLCGLFGFSQSFNYQAVVRDASGDPVSNQSIGVQVQILEGAAPNTLVYTETHTITSTAQGVISLQIGTGTTSDTFITIDWSQQNQWIGIAVDITGGTTYVSMGTSKLQQVPYALYAANSGDKSFETTNNVTSNASGTIGTDDFVFGSSQLNDIENNTSDNVRMYFDKSKGAFRLGSAVASDGFTGDWNEGNVGDFSVVMGRASLAQGTAATAFGTYNNAGGENAFTAGFQNLASRPSTIALGARNSVSGFYAVGIGRGTQSTTYGQHTIGLFSEFVNGSDAAYVATDPLFIIGNGIDDSNRTNALVMRKNGNTTLNGSLTIDGDNAGAGTSYTFPAQDGTANQIMSTDGAGNVSWITHNTSSTGLEQITEGSNTGWRLTGRDPANYGDIGFSAVDLSISEFASTDNGATGNYAVAIGQRVIASANNSIAIGDAVEASNNFATAIGYGNTASGYRSFAAGESNTASASSSVAIGNGSTASGLSSVALGRGTNTSGFFSTSMGFFTNANSHTSFALGRYNVGGGTTDSWVATDPLFEIGNGSSTTNKSNALTILKNGNAQLNGSLTIDGDNAGAGAAYTLPAQDGTANQVMSTDGSGNASWTTVNSLPSGGTNGQILGVSGIGVQWLDYDEVDGDTSATNEIELPAQTGNAGTILTTDGTNPSWTSDVSASSVTTNALTITSLPSFCADLNATLALSGAGNFFKVPSWRTSDAAVTNLHDNGNHFDEATGAFTAPVNGFYFFSAQVRFDGINSGFFRLLVGVEGALSLENGLHAISQGDATTNFHTLSVSGVLRLSAGEKVHVNVTSSADTSWSLQTESGFSGYLISRF